MDPTELDRIADLLRRWQHVEGPMDRVRVVTDATDALRNLSSMDARVLAQGLWEHGAGPAAEQVAHRAGSSAAQEELAEVAQQVLNLDHREVERLAHELRDPTERQRLLRDSGVSPDDLATHVPERPPSGEPLDLPPPPGAGETTGSPPPDSGPTDPPRSDQGGVGSSTAATGQRATDQQPRSPADAGRSDDVLTGTADPGERSEDSIEPASERALDDGGSPPHGAPDPRAASHAGVSASSTSLDPAAGLAKNLRTAPNGRQRLLHLEEEPVVVHGAEVLRILRATPDGWQRRTVLRKLIAADQVRSLDDPTAVVTAFSRDGDRFAVAAALVRTGLADVASVVPPLRQRDAARLRRRVT